MSDAKWEAWLAGLMARCEAGRTRSVRPLWRRHDWRQFVGWTGYTEGAERLGVRRERIASLVCHHPGIERRFSGGAFEFRWVGR